MTYITLIISIFIENYGDNFKVFTTLDGERRKSENLFDFSFCL